MFFFVHRSAWTSPFQIDPRVGECPTSSYQNQFLCLNSQWGETETKRADRRLTVLNLLFGMGWLTSPPGLKRSEISRGEHRRALSFWPFLQRTCPTSVGFVWAFHRWATSRAWVWRFGPRRLASPVLCLWDARVASGKRSLTASAEVASSQFEPSRRSVRRHSRRLPCLARWLRPGCRSSSNRFAAAGEIHCGPCRRIVAHMNSRSSRFSSWPALSPQRPARVELTLGQRGHVPGEPLAMFPEGLWLPCNPSVIHWKKGILSRQRT